jgi:hypothetical protein
MWLGRFKREAVGGGCISGAFPPKAARHPWRTVAAKKTKTRDRRDEPLVEVTAIVGRGFSIGVITAFGE